MLPSEIKLQTGSQLERIFGKGFSTELNDKLLNQWVGPIKSSFGLHFIYLKERSVAEVKPFESVKNKVFKDWQYQQIQSFKETFNKQLLEKYVIVVQPPQQEAKEIGGEKS